MTFFLILYISVYLLMHGYAFSHALRAVQGGRKAIAGATLFSLFMVLSPIIIRLAERNGYETAPRLLAYAGYTWMGLLFLFIALAFFCDIFAALRWCLLNVGGRPAPLSGQARKTIFIAQAALVVAIYGYGLYEANHIRARHITIASPKITAETGRFRLAQISDVHLGLIVRGARLAKILAKVEEARPDLLVSTGDLVDGQLNNMTEAITLLQQVNPPFGKLAVTGNHEFYAGLEEALDFTARAGFTLLRDRAVTINGIEFAGVDDRTRQDLDPGVRPGEAELLGKSAPETFTVLLKHRPVVNPENLGRFDLQLSGHTHKGQMFPFNVFTWLSFRFPNGLNKLESGYLYISNGSGTWGPPIRFLAPPEVTIIDLVNGETEDR